MGVKRKLPGWRSQDHRAEPMDERSGKHSLQFAFRSIANYMHAEFHLPSAALVAMQLDRSPCSPPSVRR